METKLKFSNSINFDIDSLTQERVKELIDKKILISQVYFQKNENSYVFSFFKKNRLKIDCFEIEGKEYILNPLICEEIFIVLKNKFITNGVYDNYIKEVKVNLATLLTPEEKMEYLINEYYKSFKKQDISNFSEYMIFTDFGSDSDEWKLLVYNHIFDDINLVMNYLKMDFYDFLENSFKPPCFYMTWVAYEINKKVSDFCKSQIEFLENNETVKLIKSSNVFFKNTTQKTILFEKILSYKDWNSLSVNKQSEILSPIFGTHHDTIRKSLDILNPAKQKTKKDLPEDQKIVDDFLNNLGVNLGDPSK